LAYENGDETVTCGALDIDGNRVGTDGGTKRSHQAEYPKTENGKEDRSKSWARTGHTIETLNEGRFPSQAFVSPETAEILDKQSGVSKGDNRVNKVNHGTNSKNITFTNHKKGDTTPCYSDTGGASKILHKCEFETADFDLFIYEPKVSASERNAGCENLEKKSPKITGDWEYSTKGKALPSGNNHPTLKPIDLNYKIGKLFKTPNPQTVLVPFSGAGSELIGLFKAGFENIKGCELNPEFVEISKARVRHHCTDLFNPNPLEE
jgi:site-specific DNA-methyltransferase (adenine-specific)